MKSPTIKGALGYGVYQTLFIGPNSVVVEWVSDLLFIQTISAILEEQGREGLNQQWTITPVGGSDKILTFVSLISAQTRLNVVTLIDVQKKYKQTIENLFKKKLLQKNHVLTFADFTSTTEADIEDMFDTVFYIRLVNEEFQYSLLKPVAEASLNGLPRIISRLESYFEQNPMKDAVQFNHHRPARYFSENADSLKTLIPTATLDRFEQAFMRLNALL
jgi:hypothetical protein